MFAHVRPVTGLGHERELRSDSQHLPEPPGPSRVHRRTTSHPRS
jgi:hypothetical protein